MNGVPVLCSGSGCSCDGTTENCNNITATVTLDGNDFGSCLNTIQLSLDPAPFTPILCITPGPAIFSGTIQVWQDPYKGCSGLGGGDGCNRPTVGGPVDVATGEMFYEVPDLLVVGPVAIEIRRRYESHSTFSGPLTTGWTHSYLMRIESAGTNRQVFIDEEGRSIYFSQNAQGGYGTNGIDQLTLTTPGSPTWRVTDKNQTRRDFDSSGRLTEIRDRNGNTLTFGYTGNNLTSITDIFGRSVTLTYDGSNRLQTIVAGTRTVTYTYVSGQLQRVDYPDSTFFTYEYNDPNDADNLTAIKDALAQVVETHVYDTQDRVTHTESDGGNNSFDLVYDTATQTTVTNAGTIDTVYTHDSFSGLVTSSNGPGCPRNSLRRSDF